MIGSDSSNRSLRPLLALGGGVMRRMTVLLGASLLTALCFMVLPLIQSVGGGQRPDTELLSMDTGSVPPPPPPPEPEPEPEELEPEPPEMEPEPEQLSLDQLELALNPGFGGGISDAGFGGRLDQLGGEATKAKEALFSLSDLDQKPRLIAPVQPKRSPQVRAKMPGSAVVLFVVNDRGRVQIPKISRSDDPVFERPALDAVARWKFEPGRRQGKAVSTRMRVTVTFKD